MRLGNQKIYCAMASVTNTWAAIPYQEVRRQRFDINALYSDYVATDKML